MQRLRQQVLSEILWLGIALVVSAVFAFLIFGKTLLSGATDLHLHDTYFVFAPLQALIPVFLLATFAVYLIKVFRYEFRQKLGNWIFLLAGLAVIFTLDYEVKFLLSIFGSRHASQTSSVSGTTTFSEPANDAALRYLTIFLTVVEFSILSILLYATYRWGRNRMHF